jgi:hypothetical protein
MQFGFRILEKQMALTNMKPETMLFSSWKMLKEEHLRIQKPGRPLRLGGGIPFPSRFAGLLRSLPLSGWLAQVPSLDRQAALETASFSGKDFGAGRRSVRAEFD